MTPPVCLTDISPQVKLRLEVLTVDGIAELVIGRYFDGILEIISAVYGCSLELVLTLTAKKISFNFLK